MREREARIIEPGMQIGRWTVQDDVRKFGSRRKWYCRCACGTERWVLERSLMYGSSQSCGCLRGDRAREALSPDLTGRQFGQLTVLGRVVGSYSDGALWRCLCSCGEETVTKAAYLLSGQKTHCAGAAHETRHGFTDITGQRFGRLTAQYPSKRTAPGGSMLWHCLCDCGGEADVPCSSLISGNRKSCGCRKREHDQKLRTYLTHVAGTSLDMVKSKRVPKDNTTGYRGVYAARGKYHAKIVFQKKQYYLGAYDRVQDAAAARLAAEQLLFDDVAAHYAAWKRLAEADPSWAEENPVQVIVTRQEKALSVTLLPQLGADGEKDLPETQNGKAPD